MARAFEPIEQHFVGTVEELGHFLVDYVLFRHALRPPEAKGDYLALAPIRGVEQLWVLRRFNEAGVELSSGLQGEGTFALSQMTAEPPRARYICRPLTEVCAQLALHIGREIERNRYDIPQGQQVTEKGTKLRGKRGMQFDTEKKLAELRCIRRDGIQCGSIPKRHTAMQLADITYKTWKKHAPELYAKWSDKTYTEQIVE